MSGQESSFSNNSKTFQDIFSKIEELSNVGGWMFDVLEGKNEWTVQVYKIHDLSAEDHPTPINGLDFYLHQSRVLLSQAMQDCIHKQKHFDLKLQLKSASGVVKDVHIKGKPEVVQNEVVRVWGTLQDITDFEQRVRNLEDERLRLSEAQAVSSLGFYLSDLKKGTWTGSQGFYDKFGFKKEDEPFTDEQFYSIIHPDDYVWFMQEYMDSIYSKTDFYAEYRCINLITKEIVWVKGTARAEYDITGSATRLIGVKLDVSEYKALMDQQKKTNEELQDRNLQLEQYTYITSHDLKSPLNSIIGLMELVKMEMEDIDNPELKEYINMIDVTATKMQMHVAALLKRAKIGERRNQKLLNLNEPLEDAIQDLSETIKVSQAKIKAEPLPTLLADTTEFRILFQNIIENAIRYAQTNVPPEITISYTENEESFHFQISDNGRGVPNIELPLVFDMFYRAENVKNEVKGKGVGLAFCKKIVSLYGGEIWMTSILNQGSTVHFTILK